MTKWLKDEIDHLDPWFNDLKTDEIDIHGIEYHSFGTVVIWSDEKGYSYSYKCYDDYGRGISGTFESLSALVKNLNNFS